MNDFDNSPTEPEGQQSSPAHSTHDLPSAWLNLPNSDVLSTDTLSNAEAGSMTVPAAWVWQPTVPGYDLIEEIGRGTSGVVFRALQHSPARTVALKMMLGHQLSKDALERFRKESDSLARLQHPGIVQIFEVSTADGHPYYSMEYCGGGTLTQRINGTPLPPREAAVIAARLAAAMQKAHEAGIVHRDLKPGNVLISDCGSRVSDSQKASTNSAGSTNRFTIRYGKPENRDPQLEMVKISDFGLAKHLDADTSQTRTGAILGTPCYMSPEQVNETSTVTPSADIWSLGAVLYEMLTGRPPFNGATVLATLDQVRNQSAVPPSRLNPQTPRDLETICLKCLEKEPRKRYASAADLADDLGRFLESRPIAARPISLLEVAARWCRRRPGMAALTAFAVVAVIALIAGGFVYSRRVGVAEGDKRAAEEIARAAGEQEAAFRYQSRVAAAREVLERRRLGWCDTAAALLDEAARIETATRDPVELRSAFTVCLTGVDLCDPRTVCPRLVPGALAFSPGPRRLLAVGQFRGITFSPLAVQVVDAGDDSVVHNLKVLAMAVWNKGPVPDGIQAMAFSPDERWLVAGTRAGNIYRWDMRAKEPDSIGLAGGHSQGVNRLAFAPDGKTLYSAGSDGKVLRWDVGAGWKQIGVFSTAGSIESVAVLPGGEVIASGGGKLHFLDPGALTAAADACPMPGIGTFSLRSDGATVAVERGRQVGIVSLAGAPQLVRSLRDPFADTLSEARLGGVQFSPDGALLVTAAHLDDDRRLKIWDSANGRLLGALFVPGSGPIAATFSPDGKHLAIASGRRTLLYRVEQSPVVSNVSVGARQVRAFDWSPEGADLAMVDLGDDGRGRFAIVRAADRALRLNMPFERRNGRGKPGVAWSERGGIAWCSEASRLTVLREKDLAQAPLTRDGVEPSALAFDPAGILWGGVGNKLFRWTIPGDAREIPPGQMVWMNILGDVFRGSDEISAIAAGATRAVLVTRDGGAYLFRPGQNNPDKILMTNFDPLQSVAMTRDQSRILAGSRGGKLYVFDAWANATVAEIDAATDSLDAVDIAPDGKLFATGARDGVLKLWHWAGQPELLLSVASPTPIHKVRFSPDGARLAILHSGEAAVRVWNINHLKERLARHGLGW